MDFMGQTALIIGGGSGIGAATAARFAELGASVVITGRRSEVVAATARTIGADWATLDGTDQEALGEFFAAERRYDHLVLAFSGGKGAGPVASLPVADLREAFEAKVFGHVATLQAALGRLTENASVTFISAVSARAGLPGTAGLAAVNGAIEAMVRPLATELAPMRVNAVSPGVIDTEWWSGMPEEARREFFEGYSAKLPARRVGRPEDVAGAVVALAGNAYVTGSVLEVAGGAHIPA